MAGEKGYALRLPPELKAWLEEQARANRRSLNSEIVFRLEQSRLAEAGHIADALVRQSERAQ
jgi:Arc-like DNA binding dprotein